MYINLSFLIFKSNFCIYIYQWSNAVSIVLCGPNPDGTLTENNKDTFWRISYMFFKGSNAQKSYFDLARNLFSFMFLIYFFYVDFFPRILWRYQISC